MSAPETTDALAERVLLGLPRLSSTPTVAEQDDAHAALTTLADRVTDLETADAINEIAIQEYRVKVEELERERDDTHQGWINRTNRAEAERDWWIGEARSWGSEATEAKL